MRAEQDERTLVCRMLRVDGVQPASDLRVSVFVQHHVSECRVLLEWGPRQGWVLDLVMDLPALTLQS